MHCSPLMRIIGAMNSESCAIEKQGAHNVYTCDNDMYALTLVTHVGERDLTPNKRCQVFAPQIPELVTSSWLRSNAMSVYLNHAHNRYHSDDLISYMTDHSGQINSLRFPTLHRRPATPGSARPKWAGFRYKLASPISCTINPNNNNYLERLINVLG